MASTMQVEMAFPVPRTHCGFALGNGNSGALVWGKDRLHVTVNRTDFWDHRGGQALAGEHLYRKIVAAYDPDDPSKVQGVFGQPAWPEGMPPSTRLPMGRFEVAPRRGLGLDRGVLDLASGRLHVHLRADDGEPAGTVVLGLHPKRHVLWIDDPAGLLGDVTVRPAWEWVGESLAARGRCPVTAALALTRPYSLPPS